MPIAGTVVLLFLLAAAVALAARRLRLPYTVALVVAGLALGSTDLLQPPALTKELLFALFLPGLLFEAAFHLDAEEFWKNRRPIFSLALPGVIGATFLTAPLLGPGFRALGVDPVIELGPAFIFATLIAATDPIAVVALVRTLGAPTRLGLLIESESLLNDGTAAVALSVTVAYVLGSAPTAIGLVLDFAYQVGFGALVGAGVGWLVGRLAKWIDDPMLMITVTVAAAYGSFVAGDAIRASGVIATVTTGLVSGNRSAREAMSLSVRQALQPFWDYVAFALNSLVFLLIGFSTRIPSLLENWGAILVAYVVVTIARAGVTAILAKALPKEERLSWRWTAILAWSGLRGALAMVLALSLPPAVPQRDLIITITVGVVVLSILVQGLTVKPLLRYVGLAKAGAR